MYVSSGALVKDCAAGWARPVVSPWPAVPTDSVGAASLGRCRAPTACLPWQVLARAPQERSWGARGVKVGAGREATLFRSIPAAKRHSSQAVDVEPRLDVYEMTCSCLSMSKEYVLRAYSPLKDAPRSGDLWLRGATNGLPHDLVEECLLQGQVSPRPHRARTETNRGTACSCIMKACFTPSKGGSGIAS